MPRIRQHVPGFVDGYEPKHAEFATLAELLAIPWVASWSGEPGFYRYSYSGRHLMIERDNGDWWGVIGSLSEIPEGLPEWKMTEAGQAKVDRWNAGDFRAFR